MITYEECIGLGMYEVLQKIQEMYGEKEAFSWWESGTIKTVTYQDFVCDIRKLAYYYDSHSLKGKRIVISGRNRYEQVIAMFAAVTMGASAAMLNFDLSAEQLSDELERIQPALIVYTLEEEQVLKHTLQKQIPVLLSVSDIQDEKSRTVRKILDAGQGLYALNEKPDLSAPSLLLMTSGSTSRSKWVVLPQRVFWPHDKSPTGDQILVLPLYHIAVISAIFDNICQGVRLCLSDMGSGIRDIIWFRPKLMLAVPMFLSLLVKKAKRGEIDLSCFEMIGSSGAPEELSVMDYFTEKGIVALSLYGATETTGAVTYSEKDMNKRGSVGRIGNWNEVRISEQGEILVKGSSVMTGYLDDTEATQAALEDGWFHTGDVGYIDEDGFLFITGRIKNIIILSNGENVSPETLEKALKKCEQIQEAVVRAEDDLIAAHVYCGPEIDEEKKGIVKAFIDHYNKNAPTYHRIRRIVFRDMPFEKTASGKVKR